MGFFQELSTFFYSASGNIAYHLVLGFSIAGAFFSALKSWQRKKFPQGYRMLIGLSFLLIIRLVLLVGSGTLRLDASEIPLTLHVLNRAADILGVIFIFWLWAFPEPDKLADRLVMILSLLTFSLIFVQIFVDQGKQPSPLNGFSHMELAWATLGITLTTLGCGLLIRRRPNAWEFGLALGIILLTGQFLHIINPNVAEGLSGQIRLSQLAAYPLLIILPYRFLSQDARSIPEDIHLREGERGRRRSTIDLDVLRSILAFSPTSQPKELYQNIVRLTSLAIVADICLLIEAPEPQHNVDVLSGYDLIRQDFIPGFRIESKRIPLLSTFIRREQTLHLPASSTSRDLINLSHILQLRKTGHLLATPIRLPGSQSPKGLVLLSPFSERQWINKDQNFLNDLVEIITDSLTYDSPAQNLTLERMKQGLKKLKERYEAEREKNAALHDRLDHLKDKMQREQTQIMTSTQDIVDRLRRENQHLKERNEKLSAMAFADDEDQLRSQLKLALNEIASLKEELDTAKREMEKIQRGKHPDRALSLVQQEALADFVREVQEPLQSLLRDSDLLLDQSINTLNSIQRKMLQRMKEHKDQIDQLMEDTMLGKALTPPKTERPRYPADFKTALQQSLKAIKEQIQGKDISLNVDLPRTLIPLDMSQDVLNDILIILLANAINESPRKGAVRLKLRMYKEQTEQSFAHIQITDQGKGYIKSELPYLVDHHTDSNGRAPDQEIRLDLASVRDMVEENDGRIWVESQPGQGTTLSLLLPFIPRDRLNSPSPGD